MRFAETYGMKPWEVASVPMVWWYRWAIWEQARAAHTVWPKPLKDQKPDEAKLTNWAAIDGKY